MSVNDFIKVREKDWQRLQALIEKHRRLSAAEVKELGVLYRAVTSDLALARRDYQGQRVTMFLNQLLTKVHSSIYQQDASDYRKLWRYFAHQIPQTFRRTAGFMLFAFVLFIVPAVISFLIAYRNPDVAEPLGMTNLRDMLANESIWTNIPVEERPYAASFIMSNNIRVAILAFGGGVLFGLFTVYIITMNGVSIGAILGLAAHYGMGDELVNFMFAHGVIELSVIFMAGGAGFQLGWALINPGLYSRRDALSLAARRAVPLAVIAIPLLIVAATIEGFLSPTSAPFIFKVAVGLVSGGIMYSYLLLMGRGEIEAL